MDKNIRLSKFLTVCTVILTMSVIFIACGKNSTKQFTMRDAQVKFANWLDGWYVIENLPVAKSVVCYTMDEYFLFEINTDFYELDLSTGEIDEESGLRTERLIYKVCRNEPYYTTEMLMWSLDQSYTYGGPERLLDDYKDALTNYQSKYVYKEDELKKFIHTSVSYKQELEEYYNKQNNE